jgi:small subunit ribosomal protein S11
MKKVKKVLTKIQVKCGLNNTTIHVTNFYNKNVIVSTGTIGFKKAKRATTYAAQQVAEYLGAKLFENKVYRIIIIFKGVGKGRKSVIKGFKKKIKILKIIDKTLTPHNGCRLAKQRRL